MVSEHTLHCTLCPSGREHEYLHFRGKETRAQSNEKLPSLHSSHSSAELIDAVHRHVTTTASVFWKVHTRSVLSLVCLAHSRHNVCCWMFYCGFIFSSLGRAQAQTCPFFGPTSPLPNVCLQVIKTVHTAGEATQLYGACLTQKVGTIILILEWLSSSSSPKKKKKFKLFLFACFQTGSSMQPSLAWNSMI